MGEAVKERVVDERPVQPDGPLMRGRETLPDPASQARASPHRRGDCGKRPDEEARAWTTRS